MEDSSKASVLMKMYDFLKALIPHINRYPRDQRFILGTRTETLAIEVLELLIEAYYLPKEQKRAKLNEVNLGLEKLRYLLRMSYDLGYCNSIRYGDFAEKLLEIGRMVGGWLKSV